MPLINCRHCQNKIAVGATTCPHCGANFPEGAKEKVYYSRQEKLTIRGLVLGVVFVLIVIVVAFGVFKASDSLHKGVQTKMIQGQKEAEERRQKTREIIRRMND